MNSSKEKKKNFPLHILKPWFSFLSTYIYIYIYMSSTPEPLRFVYGRWRMDTPKVKSCVNIPEVEVGKQFLKIISIAYRKSNRALTYRKSRGVSNEWKWVAWKEKMTTWTFHVLKAWNSYDLSTVVDESTHRKYDGSTSTVTSRWIRVDSTTSPTHLRSYSRNIF